MNDEFELVFIYIGRSAVLFGNNMIQKVLKIWSFVNQNSTVLLNCVQQNFSSDCKYAVKKTCNLSSENNTSIFKIVQNSFKPQNAIVWSFSHHRVPKQNIRLKLKVVTRSRLRFVHRIRASLKIYKDFEKMGKRNQKVWNGFNNVVGLQESPFSEMGVVFLLLNFPEQLKIPVTVL